MRHYICILLFWLSADYAFGQLKIVKQAKLTPSSSEVAEFIKLNKFDYALIHWGTSNWVSIKDTFYCLIKQHRKYYLAKIVSIAITGKTPVDHLTVLQKELKKSQADSLFKVLKVDSAFYYTQKQLNKLPEEGCIWSEDGKTDGFNIMDGGIMYMTQFSEGKMLSLQKYAPKYLLEHCAPHVPEFKMLKGLVNTTDKLTEA
ncbi:MAG: hypothetical protein EOP41_10235, partial [Sphingobacteriaceae bacterium]